MSSTYVAFPEPTQDSSSSKGSTNSVFQTKYIAIIVVCSIAVSLIFGWIRRRRRSRSRIAPSAAWTSTAPPPLRPQSNTTYRPPDHPPPQNAPYHHPFPNSLPPPFQPPPGPPGFGSSLPPKASPDSPSLNSYVTPSLAYPPPVQPTGYFSPPPGPVVQGGPGRPSPGGLPQLQNAGYPPADAARMSMATDSRRVLRRPDHRGGSSGGASPPVSPISPTSGVSVNRRTPDVGGSPPVAGDHREHVSSHTPTPTFGDAMTLGSNGELVLSLGGSYPSQEKAHADQRRAFDLHESSPKPDVEAGPAPLDYMAPRRPEPVSSPSVTHPDPDDALPPPYQA